MEAHEQPYALRLPVLITAFSRYDTTRQVIEAVRLARPPRVYFACDGPRNDAEQAVCERVRSLQAMIDWDCELHTLFHERNLGCKAGMDANISWFFAQEEEGIVLEDDIVPDLTFFRFAQEMLEKYRHDERIWAIIGNNLSAETPVAAPDSYWLNAHGYGAYWGWASWRRSWQQCDISMQRWPEVLRAGTFDDFYLSAAERREATALFSAAHSGELATSWDYQFDFAKMLAGAANIIPEANLCRNIGFGAGGTHTIKENDTRNRSALHQARFPLKHPVPLAVDPARDLAYFNAFIRPTSWQRFKHRLRAMLPPVLIGPLTVIARKLEGARS